MTERNRTRPLVRLALIPLAPLIFAVVILTLPLVLIRGAWERFRTDALRRQFLAIHGRQGKRALLVYSNSPNWKSYIEERWLPRMAEHVVVLNWSERGTWSRSALETRVFRTFSGDQEFNPIAIIFLDSPPSVLDTWLAAVRRGDLHRIFVPHAAGTEIVRFWKAFRDFKHGRDRRLKDAEGRMFTALGIDAPGA